MCGIFDVELNHVLFSFCLRYWRRVPWSVEVGDEFFFIWNLYTVLWDFTQLVRFHTAGEILHCQHAVWALWFYARSPHSGHYMMSSGAVGWWRACLLRNCVLYNVNAYINVLYFLRWNCCFYDIYLVCTKCVWILYCFVWLLVMIVSFSEWWIWVSVIRFIF